EALYWMAKSYVSLNEPAKAADIYINLQKKYPKSEFAPTAMLENALLQKNHGDANKADSIFLSLQELYPDDQSAAQAGFERASIKYSLGDTSKAIAILNSVINDYETSEFADQSLHLLGMYYRSKGIVDSARYYLVQLAEQDHNLSLAAEARYRLGELCMREDSCEAAVKEFEIVKDKFSGFEDWFTLSLLAMGECYEKLEQYDSAREVYQVVYGLRAEDDYGKTAKRRIQRLPK
ncbi:MAG: hypothetical protein QG635_1173, partial [Bacteroidota bacterium]|nr:hypothetical protein [Bacteroidota bacterium]